ncbi:hypothetical protein ACLOJK_023680 [Asimina triloba]
MTSLCGIWTPEKPKTFKSLKNVHVPPATASFFSPAPLTTALAGGRYLIKLNPTTGKFGSISLESCDMRVEQGTTCP